MRNKLKTFCILLMAILVAVPLSSASTLAAGKIEPERPVNFTIHFKDGETVIPNYAFSIYKVADVDAYYRMTLTSDFEKYRDSVAGLNDQEHMDQDGWRTLASTLRGYVYRDAPAPIATGRTGQDGKYNIPELPVGLYLVNGTSLIRVGDYTYSAVPFMVFLPAIDEVRNEWNYDVTVIPKYLKNYEPDEPGPGGGGDTPSSVSRKVLKLWDDMGAENQRPSEVTVQLLKDGSICDTRTLNRDNNWRYEWTGLGSGHEWDIVEQEIPGYEVSIERSGITFTVVNHRTGPVPVGQTPSGGTLPQTGMLWWPVPILFFTGCIFIIIGIVCRRKVEQ